MFLKVAHDANTSVTGNYYEKKNWGRISKPDIMGGGRISNSREQYTPLGYPAKLLAGYSAKSVSGTTLHLSHSGRNLQYVFVSQKFTLKQTDTKKNCFQQLVCWDATFFIIIILFNVFSHSVLQ